MSLFKKFQHFRKSHVWANIVLQLMFFLFIFLLISFWQTRNATRGAAPEFILNDIHGTPINIQQYQGKPLLLHFWATWCPVCSLEHGSLNNLSKDYQVLTIASWSGTASEVQHYMQQENLHFPVIVDNDGELAKHYGVQGVPTSFFISDSGVVEFVEQGYTTEIGFRLRLKWL